MPVGWQIVIWGSIAISVLTGIILNSALHFNFGQTFVYVFVTQSVFSTIEFIVWRHQVRRES